MRNNIRHHRFSVLISAAVIAFSMIMFFISGPALALTSKSINKINVDSNSTDNANNNSANKDLAQTNKKAGVESDNKSVDINKSENVKDKTENNTDNTSAKKSSTEDKVLVAVQNMPLFPGGDLEMKNFVKDNLKYPKLAKDQLIEGLIIVSFIVGKDGVVRNPKIIKSIKTNDYCIIKDEDGKDIEVSDEKKKTVLDAVAAMEEECKRVVKCMPEWGPGTQRGEKVNVKYVMPFNFKID